MIDHKVKRALKLYPFYEAVSGDLLFFSVIQTLFLTLVKGFSAAQLATIILLTDIVDLALEYPTYRVIRKIGNSRAGVIGGIMPLIGIVMITVGESLPMITGGMVFFISAGNFQSMAGAAAKNNMMLLGEKEEYTSLFAKSNTIYSALSMVSVILIPFLFSINRYIPSVLCIITCVTVVIISFLIFDYSEDREVLTHSKEHREPLVKIGKGHWILLVVFCLFFCSGAVFTSNTEVFLSNLLKELFYDEKTIFIYGIVLWAARLIRLCSNIFLKTILEKLKERVFVLAAVTMLFAFFAVGISSLLFSQTIVPIIIAGFAYVAVKGFLWDPTRTFLRMSAVDTNSKKKQQTMLVLLNAGQSVVSILMDLVVVSILKIFALEYVFLVFSGIGIIIVICAVMLRKEFKSVIEIMYYETVLDEKSIDRISQLIYDNLMKTGMESREALSYRILSEEELSECISEGKRYDVVCVRLFKKLDNFHLSLKVGGKERDIFRLPTDGDPVSEMIFHRIIRSI